MQKCSKNTSFNLVCNRHRELSARHLLTFANQQVRQKQILQALHQGQIITFWKAIDFYGNAIPKVQFQIVILIVEMLNFCTKQCWP